MSQLRKSNDKKIAGVCGGLAEHWGTDPLWVRVAAGVGAFAFFPFVIVAYLLLWWLLPDPTDFAP